MDEARETSIPSLTSEELKQTPGRRPTADEFRQQAGVQPVDKKGKALGTHIPKPAPEDVERAKKIPPQKRTSPQFQTLKQYY